MKSDSQQNLPTSSEREAEASLIRRVIAGERDEYAKLVNAHEGLVLSMIKRQVSEDQIARELAQEAFVKAYLNLSKFKFESRFSTWITRIALNETANYFSSKRFKEQKLTHSFDSRIHDRPADTQTDRDPPLSEFKIALGKLNPIHRDVIVLCSLERKSYEEAAEILAIPVGTIRSRLNKARLLLRELIIEQIGKPEVSA